MRVKLRKFLAASSQVLLAWHRDYNVRTTHVIISLTYLPAMLLFVLTPLLIIYLFEILAFLHKLRNWFSLPWRGCLEQRLAQSVFLDVADIFLLFLPRFREEPKQGLGLHVSHRFR